MMVNQLRCRAELNYDRLSSATCDDVRTHRRRSCDGDADVQIGKLTCSQRVHFSTSSEMARGHSTTLRTPTALHDADASVLTASHVADAGVTPRPTKAPPQAVIQALWAFE